MKEQWRTVGYLKEHLAVDQPRLRVGPALYGAKRTVAAQKCGLLSERDWSVSLFFFAIGGVFAIFFGLLFISFVANMLFWQVFSCGTKMSYFEENNQTKKEKKKKDVR